MLGTHLKRCLKPSDALVLGDMNAHSSIFGADRTDSAGDALASMAAEWGLRLLNDKNARTQPNTGAGGVVRWSAPDLAFATPRVARSVTSWHVCTGVGGCTHMPVLFDVCVVRVRRPAAQFRWKVGTGLLREVL